jgi:hypothetical protein
MPLNTNRGVFCLEGPWARALTDRSSVRPLLEVVDNRLKTKFIFRDVSTEEEARHLLLQWSRPQYDAYPIGLMAFHGCPGGIMLGRKVISLDILGDILEGRCSGRLLHFDSCSVLDIAPTEIERFRKRTRATAVSGFKGDIDWLASAAFTLNLLDYLIDTGRFSTALMRMNRDHIGACRKLGFRAVWASGRLGITGRVT